jgi:hypothetical protein
MREGDRVEVRDPEVYNTFIADVLAVEDDGLVHIRNEENGADFWVPEKFCEVVIEREVTVNIGDRVIVNDGDHRFEATVIDVQGDEVKVAEVGEAQFFHVSDVEEVVQDGSTVHVPEPDYDAMFEMFVQAAQQQVDYLINRGDEVTLRDVQGLTYPLNIALQSVASQERLVELREVVSSINRRLLEASSD